MIVYDKVQERAISSDPSDDLKERLVVERFKNKDGSAERWLLTKYLQREDTFGNKYWVGWRERVLRPDSPESRDLVTLLEYLYSKIDWKEPS